MTKIPRGLSGDELVRRLRKLNYRKVRQESSHAALICEGHPEFQPCFVPMHKAVKVGTLADILKRIADDHGMSIEELIHKLGL